MPQIFSMTAMRKAFFMECRIDNLAVKNVSKSANSADFFGVPCLINKAHQQNPVFGNEEKSILLWNERG
jgi:hypothetical protein